MISLPAEDDTERIDTESRVVGCRVHRVPTQWPASSKSRARARVQTAGQSIGKACGVSVGRTWLFHIWYWHLNGFAYERRKTMEIEETQGPGPQR